MKARRQRRIIEIIRNELVETQDELATALKKSGLSVTQATISRDIKDLWLIKVPCGNNRFCYATPGGRPAPQSGERLKRILQESVLSFDLSENIIVLKTPPGGAQGVASAIDQAGWKEIIGTVGGDDTILLVIKPKEAAQDVMKRLEEMNRG